MNIAITTRCNKNCSFCFARKSMREKQGQDMTLADFQKLVELAGRDNPPMPLKLLGGEPTIHPQFVQIIAFLTERRRPAGLISNLLYEDPQVRGCIKTAAASGILNGCLANAAELDTDAKMAVFKQNYTDFMRAGEKRGIGQITAGITLARDKTAAQETEYIAYLAQNLEIFKLRLSLDFQAENARDDFFINNKTYGQKLLAVVHKCLDLRIPISWDCKLYPCLFEEKVFEKDIAGFISQMRASCGWDGAPFDVFPDLSYIHCYPARVLSGQNILKFTRLSEAMGEIAFLKKTLQGVNAVPPVCRDCSYHQRGVCDSLCLGCQELNASFLARPAAAQPVAEVLEAPALQTPAVVASRTSVTTASSASVAAKDKL